MLRIRVLVLLAFAVLISPVRAEIKLIAVGSVPGDAIDLSNLTEKLGEGTPHNRLGGFGSAIAHVEGTRYVILPDRGPKDGASRYQARFHEIELALAKDGVIDFKLVRTIILRNPDGEPYLGDQHKLNRRIDPEAIRALKSGSVFVSDEYGPKILEFDRDGKQLRDLKIPDRFLPDVPSGDPKVEMKNKKGRANNRGFEGLALTPSGKLVASLQSPLMQDGGFDGLHLRLLELDPTTSKTREFVYPLASNRHGVNEILAINDTEFLVLERDSSAGKNRFCRLYRINIKGASDVSDVERLPAKGVVPVEKSLFMDLTTFGQKLPEKIEGLSFGPDLPDGRKLLLVTSDNDFTERPSMIFAFAVDPENLR